MRKVVGALLVALATLLALSGTTTLGAPPWVNPEEPEPAPGNGVPWLNLTDNQLRKLEALGVPVRYFDGKPAVRVRFARINAPEIFHPSSEEEYRLGLKAREFVEKKIRDSGGYVKCRAYGLGKYHRIIADVYPDDEEITLSEMLVEKGTRRVPQVPEARPAPEMVPQGVQSPRGEGGRRGHNLRLCEERGGGTGPVRRE
ncbi:thermonuclease family protein [Methanopyrus sp. SNP6]|uniref:thermonuclease family protein n=1 Tax=Methanopyrus sp. SNP6 TaxID=1937005 RepID=UPI0011E6060C|nr:thermonuclease family protein [Methanopyrus sp. SNP6]